jgi:hypothetical protein
MALKPITVFVPDHAHKALRYMAVENETTMNRVILRAIDKHFPDLHVLERVRPAENQNSHERTE